MVFSFVINMYFLNTCMGEALSLMLRDIKKKKALLQKDA